MPDNGSCLFRIRGSAQGLKGQDSSSLFTKTRYQMKNRVNETQARLQPSAATSMVWMLLRSASAMLKEHVIVRTIINPNMRIGALNRGLQGPAPQLPCRQKGKQ